MADLYMNTVDISLTHDGQMFWNCSLCLQGKNEDTCIIISASYASVLCPHFDDQGIHMEFNCKLLNVPSGDSRPASAVCKIKTVVKVPVTWCALF